MTSILLLTFLVWCCCSDFLAMFLGYLDTLRYSLVPLLCRDWEEYDKRKTVEIKEHIRRNPWAKMLKQTRIMWRHFPPILRSSSSLKIFLHSDKGERIKSCNWEISKCQGLFSSYFKANKINFEWMEYSWLNIADTSLETMNVVLLHIPDWTAYCYWWTIGSHAGQRDSLQSAWCWWKRVEERNVS